MGSKIKYSIATSLVKTISTILSDRMVGLGTVAYIFLQGGSFIKKKNIYQFRSMWQGLQNKDLLYSDNTYY